jgi:hypothetical protein
LIAETAANVAGGYGLMRSGLWVGKGVLNSLNSSRVFWTGENSAKVSAMNAAQILAAETGATTLEMTLTGKVMNALHNFEAFGKKPFELPGRAWDWASARFARGAENATVVDGL